ncbi:MAG TPA: septal ring lytic transglycosylase RlpA family protein [Steroidobacteraceae bacterium]|jgi:rare lipoprotein A|nr:septal ring lytic transglycosylase RlpA family protein [Steroidobacteraceae bacterium]
MRHAPPGYGSRVRVAVLALCTLALAGCIGPPYRPRPAAPLPAPPPPAPAPAVPPPPANIEAIPDAVPHPEPRSAHGNPAFYDTLGRRYYVLAVADGYVERGVASWYGPTFHGGHTSSGEPYDMYGMTAAHKTLPLPTYARVTNLSNGRSVVVRINDRGPFAANRLIDLSYTAAAKLDMLRQGTTLVEVRALTPGVPDNLTRSAAAPPPALYMQVGAFADPNNAQRLLTRLQVAGFAVAFVAAPPAGEPQLYRVRLGPVASVAEYDQLFARLAALGITEARLAID